MTPSTRTRSHRFSDLTGERLDRLREVWQANETEALEMAVRLAYELIGEAKADAVDAMEELARHYGDDKLGVATVAKGEPHTNAVFTIDGERVPGWTAGMVGPPAAGFTAAREPVVASGFGTMDVRHDASGSRFALGDVEPRVGSEVTVRVGDLVEHLVLRTSPGQNPRELRRAIRRDLALRRRLRAAVGDIDFDINTEPEGPPLD
jgi:hypothetical protein